ncbi:hypothetical protein MRB53_039441 [Persea americana]|nr:hypothetical protein MRB53_039441 [Persea americana]
MAAEKRRTALSQTISLDPHGRLFLPETGESQASAACDAAAFDMAKDINTAARKLRANRHRLFGYCAEQACGWRFSRHAVVGNGLSLMRPGREELKVQAGASIRPSEVGASSGLRVTDAALARTAVANVTLASLQIPYNDQRHPAIRQPQPPPLCQRSV